MSRYDAICTLVKEHLHKDTRGIVKTSTEEREAFCNVFSVGDSTYYAAVGAGVHPDARLQLRKADYEGERLVVFDGVTHYVSRVDRTSPDYVVLTLTERVGDR